MSDTEENGHPVFKLELPKDMELVCVPVNECITIVEERVEEGE